MAMLVGATSPAAGGGRGESRGHPPSAQSSTVSLPPIQDLIFNTPITRDASLRQRPQQPPPISAAFATYVPGPQCHGRVLPQLPKDECSRCGAWLCSANAECSSCSLFRLIDPFQPAGDDSAHSGSLSRRASGTRDLLDSPSSPSNGQSRRGPCTVYPGVSKPAFRRRMTPACRKTSVQHELQKHNKADREKCSRRSLRHEHKKMEIRQQARGWFATDLNSNNKKNSGLDGKKLEILQKTNEEARSSDLLLLKQYQNQQRMLQLLATHSDLDHESIAWVRELADEIQLNSRRLHDSLEAEATAIDNYFAHESRKEAGPTARHRKSGRYPTPLSSSASPCPAPRHSHLST